MKGVIVREVRSLVFRQTASTSGTIAQGTQTKQSSHIRFGNDSGTPSKAKGKAPHEDEKGHTMDRWNSHAWYYSSVTLNQVVLTPSDHDREVARTLIDLYFEMFREILGGTVNSKFDVGDPEESQQKDDEPRDGHSSRSKKGKAKEARGEAGFAEVEDANSRLISAVLTGVNRAMPFAKVDMGSGSELFRKHIDTLFLITHTSTFNISLQALVLILQVITNLPAAAPSTSKDGAASFFTTLIDRFYRTLYSSLTDQRLGTSNKQAMYLNLLFKGLKADKNIERVKAFVRRFIQVLVVGVGGAGGVEFVTGGLYLLGEVRTHILSPFRPTLNTCFSSLALFPGFVPCSAPPRPKKRKTKKCMTHGSAIHSMPARPRRHCTSWYANISALLVKHVIDATLTAASLAPLPSSSIAARPPTTLLSACHGNPRPCTEHAVSFPGPLRVQEP